MPKLIDRLLDLPDRILELAIGQIMQHLTIAHVYLDGESIARQRIPLPLHGVGRSPNSAWSEWARHSSENYRTLHDVLTKLIQEWMWRNNKALKSEARAVALATLPRNIPVGEVTVFPKAPLPESENYESRSANQ